MSNNTSVKTILILAANPTNTANLRLGQEVREIEEGLQRAVKREQFKLVQKWAVRSRDFYRAILDYQPQLVHFCGHGAGEDGIVLEDEAGEAALVSADTLAGMFEVFGQNGVECVMLNACFSKVQAEAISQHVNYVIGMNQALGDIAAINFAVAFYDTLVAGKDVESAFKLGCAQLIGLGEHLTPELKKRAVIVPSQLNFIPPNPYQGLFAFGEKDAEFFFGREKFVESLVKVVHKQPLVAVVGSSGSGKSSVVFAGLVPQLRKEDTWLIESFRPSDKPFYQLASALVRQLEPELKETEQLIKAGKLGETIQEGTLTLQEAVSRIIEKNPKKQLLLIADQFEELYTLCQNKEERQHFIDMLLSAINQRSLTLVLTLRADFYDDVLSYPPFCNALQQFTPQLLSSMSREELKAAIEQPAQKLKVQLQAHLTERILDDVGQEPGNLPLLEFALTELWKKQQNNELTHDAYDEIGGVKQALVKHAEQFYENLSHEEQNQTKRIFLSLVSLGKEIDGTRRIATREEVGEENWKLVIRLAGSKARLVVTGLNERSEDTIEVVHEALIREWKRLRGWIDENREKLIRKRKIEAAAEEWKDKKESEESKKSDDYLLRGKQLKEAKAFQKEQAKLLALSPLACEFIQRSLRYRRNNRLRIISFGLIPITLFAIVLGLIVGTEIRISHLRNNIEKAKGNKDSYIRLKALEELVNLGVPLDNIDLRETNLDKVSLSGANLVFANLSGANLSGANLESANLFLTEIKSANLSNAYLESANLSGANLESANLKSANLSGANLDKASLSGANLSSANLSSANLNFAFLDKANLESANLESANLSGAYLIFANLSGANLSSANLSGANLIFANLLGANLKDVKLGCAKSSQNKIQCTDLRKVKNLTPEQVKQAKNWQQAIYDPEDRKILGLPPKTAK